MGNHQSITKINFEDMQDIIKNKRGIVIISTLDANKQDCLIAQTISPSAEIQLLNAHLKKPNEIKIVVYGENCNDHTLLDKIKQLHSLGYKNSVIYIGGLFEWLLMQEIYGEEEFPTTIYELDLLKYKASRKLI